MGSPVVTTMDQYRAALDRILNLTDSEMADGDGARAIAAEALGVEWPAKVDPASWSTNVPKAQPTYIARGICEPNKTVTWVEGGAILPDGAELALIEPTSIGGLFSNESHVDWGDFHIAMSDAREKNIVQTHWVMTHQLWTRLINSGGHVSSDDDQRLYGFPVVLVAPHMVPSRGFDVGQGPVWGL